MLKRLHRYYSTRYKYIVVLYIYIYIYIIKLSLVINDNNNNLAKIRRYNGPVNLSKIQIKILIKLWACLKAKI